MRPWCKVLPVSLVLVGLFMLSPGIALADSYPLSPLSDVIQDALDYLETQQAADGSIGSYVDSGWVCIASAAAGEDPNNWDQGGDSLVDYLRDNADFSGEFNLGTAYARTVLVAIAAGEDPSSFGTYTGGVVVNGDFVQGLLDVYNGTQFEDGFGSTELMNDDVWAVRALRAAGESAGSAEIAGAIDFIVANQDVNGGWSWAAPGHAWYATSADDTAAALLALLVGGYSNESIVVRHGLDYLQSLQAPSGGVLYDANPWSYDSVSSTAWSVWAIGAAGQSPVGSEWTESGDTLIDYLIGQQQGDGRFPFRDPLPGGYVELPVQNTAWAIEALVGAHYRAPAAECVVGGIAERPDVTGLILPWCIVVLGAMVVLAWGARRSTAP